MRIVIHVPKGRLVNTWKSRFLNIMHRNGRILLDKKVACWFKMNRSELSNNEKPLVVIYEGHDTDDGVGGANNN